MTPVRRSVRLPGSAERVWSALVGAAPSWLGAEVDLDARPGGRLRVADDDGLVRQGEIERVVPGSELVFTWWPERPFGLPLRTRVRLTLEVADGGTVLHVTERRVRPPAVTLPPPAPRPEARAPALGRSATRVATAVVART